VLAQCVRVFFVLFKLWNALTQKLDSLVQGHSVRLMVTTAVKLEYVGGLYCATTGHGEWRNILPIIKFRTLRVLTQLLPKSSLLLLIGEAAYDGSV